MELDRNRTGSRQRDGRRRKIAAAIRPRSQPSVAILGVAKRRSETSAPRNQQKTAGGNDATLLPSLANMRQNGVRSVTASCANCGRSADVNVEHRRANGRRLSPRPLVDFGRRRGLRERGRLWGRLELSQRRAQRIEARGVGKSVVFDGAPDRRGYRGGFVGGEVNCRHGRIVSADILPSKEAIATPAET